MTAVNAELTVLSGLRGSLAQALTQNANLSRNSDSEILMAIQPEQLLVVAPHELLRTSTSFNIKC